MQTNADWPADRGPFKTLTDLGLRKSGLHPGWARKMRVKELYEKTAYRARPLFLKSDAIRQLAALTFEGYEVEITTAEDGELALSIYERRGFGH